MKFDFRRANFKGPTAIMRLGFAISAITLAISTSSVSLAASKATINRDAKATLDKLYKNNPGAKALGDKSVGVLVFPSIVKGGFIIAGQFGDGALRRNGKSVAYYRSLAATEVLQKNCLMSAYLYLL